MPRVRKVSAPDSMAHFSSSVMLRINSSYFMMLAPYAMGRLVSV